MSTVITYGRKRSGIKKELKIVGVPRGRGDEPLNACYVGAIIDKIFGE